jgi:hypothetical protein
MDSGVPELRQRDAERRNIGAEWHIGGADKVKVEVELTQVGHTAAVSRRKTGAD